MAKFSQVNCFICSSRSFFPDDGKIEKETERFYLPRFPETYLSHFSSASQPTQIEICDCTPVELTDLKLAMFRKHSCICRVPPKTFVRRRHIASSLGRGLIFKRNLATMATVRFRKPSRLPESPATQGWMFFKKPKPFQ